MAQIIERGAMVLGLTEEQEQFFLQLLEHSLGQLAKVYAHVSNVDKKFEEIAVILENFTKENYSKPNF